MKRYFPVSVRGQLLLMALIIAVAATGIIVYGGLEQRRQAIEHAEVETQKLADTIVSEQRNLVAAAQQLAIALAQIPEVRQHDAAKVQPILKEILRLNAQYLNIVISDRAGIVWSSAFPMKKSVGLSDRRYFRNARDSGRFSSGEFIVGKIFGKPAINFGFPIYDAQGHFDGTIGVNFNLDYLSSVLHLSKLPTGSSFMLIDHEGVILARGIDPSPFIGKRDKAELFQRMQKEGEGGTFVAEANDGIMRLISYRKLYLKDEKTPYMYVRASMRVNEALSKANRSLFINLMVLTPFLAIAFLCSWLVGKRSIVDRIALLQSASKRLAEGDLQVRVSHLVSGGEVGGLGQALDDMARRLDNDVSARKLAEEARQQSERFLRAIIDTEPECVKLLDGDGTIKMMNKAGLGMLEADTSEQVIGQVAYDLIGPEYRSRFVTIMEGAYQGAEGSLEYEIVGFKGRHLWLDTVAVPFRDDQGAIVSVLAITRDISQRKLAEASLAEKQQQLEILNMTLEQRVEESIAEIRRKDQMLILQNRMASMGEMLNNIAHQWRQPLNNIGLIIQALECNYELGLLTAGEMKAQVAQAMETLQFMSRTIDDFRCFLRSEKDKECFVVNDVVKTTIDFIRATFEHNGIAVSFDAKEAVVAVGYANQYSQVILNILNNARDVLVERKVTAPLISIAASNDRGQAVVTVHDNGGGIDEAILPKIFDPFFTSKEQGKGTGIGLYMSKVIIEQNMSGSVSARNIYGGASFSILLPSAGPASEPVPLPFS